MSVFSVEYSDANLPRMAEIYAENGYVLVENVFTEKEADEMKTRMDEIVDKLNLDQHPKSVFSTEDHDKVVISLLSCRYTHNVYSMQKICIS